VHARAPGNVGHYSLNIATLLAPLNKLPQKSVAFEWTKKQQDSFQAIKCVLCASEKIAYYDRTARTIVVADASPERLGAVLIQHQSGMDKVVAHGHHSLSEVEH